LFACLTVQHHYGLGRHFFYLDPHQRVMALKYSFIVQPMGRFLFPHLSQFTDLIYSGIMAPALGRMACALLMLQLFGITKVRRMSLWITFWGSLVANLLVCILIFAQCDHVESLWDPAGHPGRCWSPKVQEVRKVHVSKVTLGRTDFVVVYRLCSRW
jgi:hypothetical protein